MAGRPAGGTSTGIVVGLFVSIGITLVSLILLVVLWTKQETLMQNAQTAKQEAERVMNPTEKTGAFRAWFDAATGSKSVAKLMHEEMTAMAELLSADADGAVPGIALQLRTQKLEPLWDTMTEDKVLDDPATLVQEPMFDGLQEMYSLYAEQHKLLLEAQSVVEEANADRERLNQEKKDLQEKFETTVSELQGKVESFESEWVDYRVDKQSVIDDSMEANTERAQEATEAAQELRLEIDALQIEISKKQSKNEELQDKIRDFQIVPQPRMAARQADGEVLLANPGEESVFVDLGRNDHLTLGLIFAVYPRDVGIPGQGQSKAQIEVTNIGEEVSECRIKRVNPVNPVIAGDLIANPIYDKARQLSFIVIGAFDLDHDGFDDPNGPGVISSVIREMGGLISDQLTARTDFVIVGARPLVKRLSSDPTAEEQAIQEDEQAVAQAYEGVLEEANSLSIPMLTQETFLNFLGRRPKALVDSFRGS